MENHEVLNPELKAAFIATLKARFKKNIHRHSNIQWDMVQEKLEQSQSQRKLESLYKMELTGGEPDVIDYDTLNHEYIFCDCSAESPKGRRSLCYDRDALDSRKEFKPENSATDMAASMGIEILTEAQYKMLQQLENFDTKTSSWLKTPEAIRKQGGAIFGDFRYGNVFIYHNGAQSYYSSRAFRGCLGI